MGKSWKNGLYNSNEQVCCLKKNMVLQQKPECFVGQDIHIQFKIEILVKFKYFFILCPPPAVCRKLVLFNESEIHLEGHTVSLRMVFALNGQNSATSQVSMENDELCYHGISENSPFLRTASVLLKLLWSVVDNPGHKKDVPFPVIETMKMQFIRTLLYNNNKPALLKKLNK